VSASAIAVSWQDNSTNETGFEVYRSTTGPSGAFALLASTAANVTAYSDGGLSGSSQYCYEVRAVRTRGGKTSYSAFSSAACATTLPPPTGDLRVTTATTGSDLDPDGYTLSVDAASPLPIPINGTLLFERLTPGNHSAALGGLAPNCAVNGANPRSVDVVAGTTVDVVFAVACAAPPPPPPPPPPFTGDIAFSSDRDGDFAIYTMNADGSNVVRYTDPAVRSAGPAWSPDGTRLAFISNDPVCPQFFDILVLNGDGNPAVRLTSCEGMNRFAAWSPDGRKLVFASDRASSTYLDDIYVMNADGSGVTRLTYGPGQNWLPAWSPDGARIVFASDRDAVYPGLYDLYTMNPDGTGVVRLTFDGANNLTPAWSPDGSRIAFASSRDGGDLGATEIYVMNGDGSGVVRLTYDGVNSIAPAWSPDGGRIAFRRAYADCDYCDLVATIAVMNADGSGLVNITDGSADAGEPSWRRVP
jgi:TolB protein